MRAQRGIVCVVFAGLVATNAAAQDMCTQLTKLLKDPPAGFVAQRAELVSPQRWASLPFLPNAKCVLWASRSEEASEIRCTINDGANPSAVTRYYQNTGGSIDRCLAALPDKPKYERRTARVDSEGLRGAETEWVHDTDAVRFKIGLTNYRRTFDRSNYNSFSVEYLKY